MPDSIITQRSELADKARAIASMFAQGREHEAYVAMAFMIAMREWPPWLKRTARDIDGGKIDG